ncbi:MAG: hypothetical protein HY804_02045 [Nitrospinae bacterium]|nr:hypothetical protein [Nitrospinota bacterium]
MCSGNKFAAALVLALALAGCGPMADDLNPSGSDVRGAPAPTAAAAPLTFMTADGAAMTLDELLAGRKAAVLYFTMWCPVCDGHQSNMQARFLAAWPQVAFVLLDYVSATPAQARQAAQESGWLNAGFTVAVDAGIGMRERFGATMGTTVVLDAAGNTLMAEDFKDGERLRQTLETLP